MTPTPRIWSRTLAGGVVAALALSLAAVQPATAADEILVETEPNDSPQQADGPVPAGGYVATRATVDDHDRFILRLQPQRQVTVTLRRGSGCGASPSTNPTSFSLVRSDGVPEVSFNSWAGTGAVTSTWTTPAVATEYRGDVFGSSWWAGNQCTVTVQVTPADAVVTGTLPTPFNRRPRVRTGDVVAGRAATATVAGTAVAGDTLVTWWGSRRDSCTNGGSSTAAATRTALTAGPYRLDVTLPARKAGRATLCALVTSPTPSLVPDAVRPHRVAVRARRALRVSRKDLRVARDGSGQLKVTCALPAGERCVGVVKVATATGTVVAKARVKVRSGKSRRVKFTLTESLSRRLDEAGVLRVDVTARVTRQGRYVIREPRTRVLLLPPR